MTQAFNIDQFDTPVEETLFKVGVAADIDGNDTCGFMITSKNSPEYQDAARQIRIDGLKRSSKRKTALDTSTDEGATAVAKMIEENELTLACSVVKDWFGFESAGSPAPFNKATVRKMFTVKPTWREKVTAALESEVNFTKG